MLFPPWHAAHGREDIPVALRRFDLEQNTEGWPKLIACQRDRKPLAKVWLVCGKTYKTACQRHPQCSLMISQGWFPGALGIAVEWVARGRSDSFAQHSVEAVRLRSLGRARRQGG